MRGASVAEALDSAVVAIGASGSASPRLDAELLLSAAVGVSREALVTGPERELEPGQARLFRDLVTRRSRDGEPVAYLLGRRGFRWIELEVDRRVLVPRPETELLVEAALGLPAGSRVLDVGTGSGAVALALKQERPDLEVTASDISAEAIAVAAANRDRLGLDVRIEQADLLDGLGAGWDAILANPPYVAEGDRAQLPRELSHEPDGALFAGPDGLAVIRRLLPAAAATEAALLAVEVGEGQADGVAAMAVAAGFGEAAIVDDLAGIGRVVVATR
jgi:release factor glutamine methyltransferase